MAGSIWGTRYYNERENEKVFTAMAKYMDQAEYTIQQLYDIAKSYEKIIKRCKCAQI
jgi:hypothetical protein